jgi:hypothetical protein
VRLALISEGTFLENGHFGSGGAAGDDNQGVELLADVRKAFNASYPVICRFLSVSCRSVPLPSL